MTKIKIGIFINNLGQGGAEKQLVELLKRINKNKFTIKLYLYAYQKDAFYLDIFDEDEIIVVKNKLKGKKSLFKILEALKYLRNELTKNDFDLIFTSLFMNSFFIRIVANRKYRNKIITSSRTSIKLYSFYHLMVEKILIRNSYLIFNSKSSLENFKKVINNKYHNKLKIIYNGFNINNGIPENRIYNSQINKIVIGGLGRRNNEKNFIQLVRVFQQIKIIGLKNSLSLILQGADGDQSIVINDQILKSEKDIKVLKANPYIYDFFSKTNILVIPSFFEGCPNVLFEAMIHNKLCIISSGANSDNFVVDNVNGFVYDGSDEGLLQSLCNAISIVNTDKEHKIINNAFCFVKEYFSMEVMVKRYENLFLEIYEKNQSSN